MTNEYKRGTIEWMLTDYLQDSERHFLLEVENDDGCQGLRVKAHEKDPAWDANYSYDDQCGVLACENTWAPYHVEIGGKARGSLCLEHLLYWLKEEAEPCCSDCAAWIDSAEAPE